MLEETGLREDDKGEDEEDRRVISVNGFKSIDRLPLRVVVAAMLLIMIMYVTCVIGFA